MSTPAATRVESVRENRAIVILRTIAASVVVLPDPVAPVTSTSPRCSLCELLDRARKPELGNFGASRGIARRASEVAPRCRNTLTRKRGRPSPPCRRCRGRRPRGTARPYGARRTSRLSRTAWRSGFGQRLVPGKRRHLARAADDRRPTELQVDVGGAELDSLGQDGSRCIPTPFGSWRCALIASMRRGRGSPAPEAGPGRSRAAWPGRGAHPRASLGC